MPRNTYLDKFYCLLRKRFFSPPMADPPLAGRKGQVLIESLIALTFLTVAFFSAFSLLGKSLSTNRASAQSYTATYLAAEGIEVARNIIDGNGIQGIAWNNGFANGNYEVRYDSTSFLPPSGAHLSYDPSAHLYSYSGLIQTPFTRTLNIELVGSDEIKIHSVVSWVGLGGGIFNINLEDHFMNWRGR